MYGKQISEIFDYPLLKKKILLISFMIFLPFNFNFKCHSNNNLLLSKENSILQNFMMFYTIIHTIKIIISDKVIKLMIFLKYEHNKTSKLKRYFQNIHPILSKC